MPNSYGLDFDTGYDMHRDSQMRSVSTEMGACLGCGELFPMEELERNDGLCLPCYYKSLKPDPDDGELIEGEEKEGGGEDA